MQELLKRLNNYKSKVSEQLTASTPKKHENHPESYRHYLRHELKLVTDKIDSIKMAATSNIEVKGATK